MCKVYTQVGVLSTLPNKKILPLHIIISVKIRLNHLYDILRIAFQPTSNIVKNDFCTPI